MNASRAGVGLTAGIGAIGAVATFLSGVWLSLPGVALATTGVYRCSRRLLGIGVLVSFLGVVVASLFTAPFWLLVPAMASVVLTWDVGENAITTAEQFPGEASTWRGEAVHAAVSALVVTGFAVAVGGVYALSTGGYSLVTVVLLVVGSLVVLIGLGR